MFVIFLVACNNKETVDKIIQNDTSNTKLEETTASDNNTTYSSTKTEPIKATTNETANKVISLRNTTVNQLQNTKLTEKEGDRILFDDYLYTTAIISDTEATFSDEYYKTVRNSSQALYCDGYDKEYSTDLINTNISDKKFMCFDSGNNDSNFYFISPYYMSKIDTTLVLNGYSDDTSQIEVQDICYEYCVNNITLNGFICKTPNSHTYTIIIDPAYMYGLPVYHSDSSLCNYTINGLNIKADTLSFTVDDFNNNLDDTLRTLGSSYVYAQLSFDTLKCTFGTKSGYTSTAVLGNYKLISKDTEKILTRSFLFENNESKDSEMIDIYNVLMTSIDTLNTNLTLGITLLDLDFDDTPEVLVYIR